MQINCYLFAQSGLNLCKQGGFCLVEAAKCGGGMGRERLACGKTGNAGVSPALIAASAAKVWDADACVPS